MEFDKDICWKLEKIFEDIEIFWFYLLCWIYVFFVLFFFMIIWVVFGVFIYVVVDGGDVID